MKNDYEIVMIIPPELPATLGPTPKMPQLPSEYSEFEICNVSVIKANYMQRPNDPSTPKTREVLIYTLRKPVT